MNGCVTGFELPAQALELDAWNDHISEIAKIWGHAIAGPARGGQQLQLVSQSWCRNGDRLLKTVLTIGHFNRLGVPRLS